MVTVVHSEDDDLVFRRIRELMGPFNAAAVELKRSTEIASDLAIDSVAVLDLIMEIEDAYDISFSMNSVAELRTIGDLVDAIHQLRRG